MSFVDELVLPAERNSVGESTKSENVLLSVVVRMYENKLLAKDVSQPLGRDPASTRHQNSVVVDTAPHPSKSESESLTLRPLFTALLPLSRLRYTTHIVGDYIIYDWH